MDDSLDIQNPLQACPSLSIEILTPTIGVAPAPQGCILSLVMICMHRRHWANGRKRTIWIHPGHTPLTLRAFDLDRSFESFPLFIICPTLIGRAVPTLQRLQRWLEAGIFFPGNLLRPGSIALVGISCWDIERSKTRVESDSIVAECPVGKPGRLSY